ncbi:DUF6252 family protein [Flavicella sediminum]|uniref:DUF6252 family protein n=1 Tax=Flavicella sediminum TaxID=2585141 RepID=UPI00111E7D00|nr:DUF6252 family protein [Flavicella sediminum]
MRKIALIFVCLISCLACTESASLSNANYAGSNPDVGNKVLSGSVKAMLGEEEFSSNQLSVHEQGFSFTLATNEVEVAIVATTKSEVLTIGLSGEIIEGETYVFGDKVTATYKKEAVRASEEDLEINMISGEATITKLDLENGKLQIKYTGILEGDVIVLDGAVNLSYVPDQFQATIPNGKFNGTESIVLNTESEGSSLFSINNFGNTIVGSKTVEGAIQMQLKDAKVGEFDLSQTSGNVATFTLDTSAEMSVATEGKVTIVALNKEENYVRGSFNFVTNNKEEISGVFSLNYFEFNFGD